MLPFTLLPRAFRQTDRGLYVVPIPPAARGVRARVAMKGRPKRALRPMTVLWYVDLAIIVLAVICAANLRFSGDPEGHMAFLQNATGRALLVGLALTGSMAMFGLYQVHLRPRASDLVLR